MEKKTVRGVVLVAMALVATVILVLPLIAQENQYQAGDNWSGKAGIPLSALQGGVGGGRMSANTMGIEVHTACVPNLTCSECFFLDTYNPNNTYDPQTYAGNLVNTATTTAVLTAGEPYLLTISGTTSYWPASSWSASTIGDPESYPMFLSPAVPNGSQGEVGFDWEYNFAYPNGTHGDFLSGGPIITYYQGISLDNGATFHDLTPLGGQVYNPRHIYRFLVVGTGQKAQVRTSDYGPHNDNYGRFKICFQHLTPCPLSN